MDGKPLDPVQKKQLEYIEKQMRERQKLWEGVVAMAELKKGYLPKPGQIVELLVKGVRDIEQRKHWERLERLELENLLAKFKNND